MTSTLAIDGDACIAKTLTETMGCSIRHLLNSGHSVKHVFAKVQQREPRHSFSALYQWPELVEVASASVKVRTLGRREEESMGEYCKPLGWTARLVCPWSLDETTLNQARRHSTEMNAGRLPEGDRPLL
jgi:hypothetical protein